MQTESIQSPKAVQTVPVVTPKKTADTGIKSIAGTANAGSSNAGTAQAGTAQAGTAQAGTAQAGTAQAGASQNGMSHTSMPQTDENGVLVEIAQNQSPNRGEPQLASVLPYESLSEPSGIETRIAAVYAFVEAYNKLWDTLTDEAAGSTETDIRFKQTAEALRMAIYQPVVIAKAPALAGAAEPVERISLYEIGVAHSPNQRLTGRPDGQLRIHEAKLRAAFTNRKTDTEALFTQPNGLLVRLGSLLPPCVNAYAPEALRISGERFAEKCDELNALLKS